MGADNFAITCTHCFFKNNDPFCKVSVKVPFFQHFLQSYLVTVSLRCSNDRWSRQIKTQLSVYTINVCYTVMQSTALPVLQAYNDAITWSTANWCHIWSYRKDYDIGTLSIFGNSEDGSDRDSNASWIPVLTVPVLSQLGHKVRTSDVSNECLICLHSYQYDTRW